MNSFFILKFFILKLSFKKTNLLLHFLKDKLYLKLNKCHKFRIIFYFMILKIFLINTPLMQKTQKLEKRVTIISRGHVIIVNSKIKIKWLKQYVYFNNKSEKKKITSVNLIYNINLYIKHFIVWTAYDEFPLSFNKFNIKQIWSFSLRLCISKLINSARYNYPLKLETLTKVCRHS